MRDMAIEWLNHGDYNVIRVNWIGGSLDVQYGEATADIRIVGAEIAFLVEQIRVCFSIIYRYITYYFVTWFSFKSKMDMID